MSYLSHPLETEGDSFHPTGRIPTRSLTPEGNSHSHLGLFDDDLWPYDSPFSTVHPLDECRECHAYIKHVDQTSIASDPAVQSYSRPGRTFFDGIEVGRQLQLEENSMYFSRYRGRLQLARKQYEESLLANSQYRDQAELLEWSLRLLRIILWHYRWLTTIWPWIALVGRKQEAGHLSKAVAGIWMQIFQAFLR
ncbi:hypothetical protein BDZ97DRAFT_1396030 [Flammula alnicola]|nr:hypothetical protein BDZ97DRAFT_1396030 [Flammula alnicola]